MSKNFVGVFEYVLDDGFVCHASIFEDEKGLYVITTERNYIYVEKCGDKRVRPINV